MSLFSDVDWVILLLVGGLLLLGGNNKELLRSVGRMYARVTRMRDEFMNDLRVSVNETSPAPAAPSVPAPTPGLWAVGTARPVAALPREEAAASLARLGGEHPETIHPTMSEVKSA